VDEIVGHYASTALFDRIVSAAGDAGLDVDNLTAADLAPVDEFHIGGRAATQSLMEHADIGAGSRVLDVGSGVGGTARYLADSGSHQVTGVDLTPAYIEVATALTELVGLGDLVEFREADARSLPFPGASFDAAVMLHVGMNIDDKAAVFTEVGRVLADGGVFALYDIMGRSLATHDFPVPWAASPSGSFLATADDYIDALIAADFEIRHVADRTDTARAFFARLRSRTGPPSPLGLHLLMGEESPLRYGNMVAAVEAGTITPVEIVATVRH